MVLHFSGTGNSRYVAREIAKLTDDQSISINEWIKLEMKEELVSWNHPFVFVCPTYAWRVPRVVEEFIRTGTFVGSNEVYFILTCGTDTSDAITYVKKITEEKGWNLKGFAEVVMPENYIAMFPVPDERETKEIIKKAGTIIHKIAEDIQKERVFLSYNTRGVMGKMKSGIVNVAYYQLVVGDKGFYSTGNCIGCEKCVKLCPLNNVKMSNHKPEWLGSCTHCMACINGCPRKAIEYKRNTKGKRRYFLE